MYLLDEENSLFVIMNNSLPALLLMSLLRTEKTMVYTPLVLLTFFLAFHRELPAQDLPKLTITFSELTTSSGNIMILVKNELDKDVAAQYLKEFGFEDRD